MKGNNTLELNEATMIEAVQEYLDKRFTKDTPLVKRITTHTVNQVLRFEVELSEKEVEDGRP